MNLLRITSPDAFRFVGIPEFAVEALKTSPIVPDAEAAVLELVGLVRDPRLGLFIICDDELKLHGLALAQACHSALSPGVTVLHFYNRHSDAESRNLLISGLVDFTTAAKLSKIWGLDINHGDLAFARLFKAGGKPVARGLMFEFEVQK